MIYTLRTSNFSESFGVEGAKGLGGLGSSAWGDRLPMVLAGTTSEQGLSGE